MRNRWQDEYKKLKLLSEDNPAKGLMRLENIKGLDFVFGKNKPNLLTVLKVHNGVSKLKKKRAL